MEHDERNVLRLLSKTIYRGIEVSRRLVHSTNDVPSSKVVVSNVDNDIVFLRDFIVGLDDLGEFLPRDVEPRGFLARDWCDRSTNLGRHVFDRHGWRCAQGSREKGREGVARLEVRAEMGDGSRQHLVANNLRTSRSMA